MFIMFSFKMLLMIISLLMNIALLTLLESKMLGYTQLSKGPNIVGFYGLLQPLADGMKLFLKEPLLPNHVNIFIFMISPLLSFFLSIMVWMFISYENSSFIMENNISMLMMMAINSISVFSIMMAGWSSNSKYGFIGSISATSQMMSYEVSLGLMIMNLCMLSCSLNMFKLMYIQKLMMSFWMPLFPISFLFFVSLMAETNSAPFDLTEGESELVSGFNIEYSGFIFALFFLGEYSHIIFSSYMFSIFFFSNIMINIYLKGMLLMMLMMWMSSSFPSFSYDQLMHLLWKNYLPMSIFIFMLMSSIFFFM